MNGTLANWLKHAALALVILIIGWIAFGPIEGAVIATVMFWAREAGEKSKDWSAPRRPLSDWNPLDSRWSEDDRMDLLVPILVVWLIALPVL